MSEPEEPEHALDATPRQAIESALQIAIHGNPEEGEPPPSKCLVLFLWDDEPGQYAIQQINSGFSNSEAIAFLEAAKFDCLKELRGTE